MLIKKQHFSTALFGRLFECKNCNGFPKVIRLIHEKLSDNILNIELISQRNDYCSVDYDLGIYLNTYENTYELVTCAHCNQPVITVLEDGGIA